METSVITDSKRTTSTMITPTRGEMETDDEDMLTTDVRLDIGENTEDTTEDIAGEGDGDTIDCTDENELLDGESTGAGAEEDGDGTLDTPLDLALDGEMIAEGDDGRDDGDGDTREDTEDASEEGSRLDTSDEIDERAADDAEDKRDDNKMIAEEILEKELDEDTNDEEDTTGH